MKHIATGIFFVKEIEIREFIVMLGWDIFAMLGLQFGFMKEGVDSDTSISRWVLTLLK